MRRINIDAEILEFKRSRDHSDARDAKVQEDEEFKRTRGYRDSERALGFVAVCLIGPSQPVRFQRGNALHWPVALRTATEPSRAPQRTMSEHWEGNKAEPFVTLLEHVWTRSEAHAGRLKSALYARMLGNDHELRQLNGGWVDLMEWQVAWEILLKEAVADLRAGGETVESFEDKERLALIRRHSEKRARA